MLSIMICTILLTPSTPEGFVQELCENSIGIEGAQFWSSYASTQVQSALSDPDSLVMILNEMQDLTVSTGIRTAFEDNENAFRIEFGESEWTWIDSNGSLHRITGLTVVVCSLGNYTWLEIPVLSSRSVSVGRKERLISGILITFMLMISTLVFLVWLKRRYL
ncbi:hypothetical protein DRQ25_06460 [Candidatus Fermentibacteria bacterium]|nr:MAG: hypothetical protein DRQ25_06460 [Candidatus Fermentibacteria bacterium]